jgi:hypothetical protein
VLSVWVFCMRGFKGLTLFVANILFMTSRRKHTIANSTGERL